MGAMLSTVEIATKLGCADNTKMTAINRTGGNHGSIFLRTVMAFT